MEQYQSDPDTQADVNLMIFDYLLCTTIENLICTGAEGNESDNENSINWPIKAVENFKSLIPPDLIPDDIQTKYHLLQVADALCQSSTAIPAAAENAEAQFPNQPVSEAHMKQATSPHPNPEKISQILTHLPCLWSALDVQKIDPKYATLAEQLIARTILEEHQASGDTLQDIINRHLERPSTKFIKFLNRPMDTSLLDYLTIASGKMSSPELRTRLTVLLQTIMTTLEPPILIQLERGKLRGLSRAETQDLKDRIGIR
ncbi:hypothetical protein FE257_010488 [Aspergillus nanangensis]|uniref:Uncharacterized protein n=1 Tax=Aspergillus nanangensis TaxID=2582783 RepID=A0AAD4GT68_ASPNN|nr:hypothetical protein FE257_010488 [Aspergillus nanangensis]